MSGRKFTEKEFKIGEFLREQGESWNSINVVLGRNETSHGLRNVFAKYGWDFETYDREYKANHKGRPPKRKTEQLQFEPPRMPRKIEVRKIEDDFEMRKFEMAKAQARAIKHFVDELRDAGFRF